MRFNLTQIKYYLKKHDNILDIIAFVYSFRFIIWNLLLILNGTIEARGAFLKNVHIKSRTNGQKFIIGRRARLSNCIFKAFSPSNKITIGGGKTIICDTEFYISDFNSRITIGKDFTMESGHIASTEGKNIIIGEDCMFANDIEIRNGDSHSIISIQSGMRINDAKDVEIGNHVWLCAHSRILKGSSIPNNSIIGNSCLVSGILTQSNSIYSGIPAKLIKSGVTWDRKR